MQDDGNPHILRMLEGTLWVDEVHLILDNELVQTAGKVL